MSVLPSFMHVCAPHACLVPSEPEEGVGSLEIGLYRWLWATMWMLGLKLDSLRKQPVFQATEPSPLY